MSADTTTAAADTRPWTCDLGNGITAYLYAGSADEGPYVRCHDAEDDAQYNADEGEAVAVATELLRRLRLAVAALYAARDYHDARNVWEEVLEIPNSVAGIPLHLHPRGHRDRYLAALDALPKTLP